MSYVRPTLIQGQVSACGTGNPVLTDVPGAPSWSSVADGTTLDYVIQEFPASGLREWGLGTKQTSGGSPQLVRTAGNVIEGSSGVGVLVNFTGATQVIYSGPLGEREVLPQGAADPAVLTPGQFWYRTDTLQAPAYGGGLRLLHDAAGYPVLTADGPDADVGLWLKLKGYDDGNLQSRLVISPASSLTTTLSILTSDGLTVETQNGNGGGIALRSAGGSFPEFTWFASQGTLEAPTASLQGDRLGVVSWAGYGSTGGFNGVSTTGEIWCAVTGTPTGTTCPGIIWVNVHPADPLLIFSNQGIVGCGNNRVIASYNVALAEKTDFPATDYERGVLRWSGNVFLVGAEAGGTGTLRPLSLEGAGVRFPSFTTTQKNALASPAQGTVVYDSTLNKLSVFTGSVWETVTSA